MKIRGEVLRSCRTNA